MVQQGASLYPGSSVVLDTPIIRVLIAEPWSLIRDALSALLAQESDLDVVAELECETSIIPTALELRPDVALIDIDSEAGDLLGIADKLHDCVPESRTLLLTEMRQPERLREAIAVGNCGGILAKDAPTDDLLEAIRKVADGRRFIDPDLALAALADPDSPLSERELEILRLTAEGKPVTEVARDLFLSLGTVRNYLSTAIRKLGARNRIDAIRIASAAGWL
jgi:two-component system, NarL family, response regulator DesR